MKFAIRTETSEKTADCATMECPNSKSSPKVGGSVASSGAHLTLQRLRFGLMFCRNTSKNQTNQIETLFPIWLFVRFSFSYSFIRLFSIVWLLQLLSCLMKDLSHCWGSPTLRFDFSICVIVLSVGSIL